MKIVMIGSGAAGSVLAAYLRRGGAELWLVDPYRAHMDKVAQDGLVLRTPAGETRLTGFRTAYSADAAGTADIAVLMVKATQTEDAMRGAAPCIGPETVVATLQNGLGNDERVAAFVPPDRIILGCGNIGTELPEPGVCVAKPIGGINLFMGPMEKSPLTDTAGAFLKAAFAAGGLCPEYYDDVRPYIWRKATSNSGFNTVCAILGLKIRQVYDDPEGAALVWQIWREAADVAAALGIPGIWEYMQEQMPQIVRNIGEYYPSMAQDVLIHRRPTEVTALTGAISDYGRRVGVPTPACDVLTRVVKALEANYDERYRD